MCTGCQETAYRRHEVGIAEVVVERRAQIRLGMYVLAMIVPAMVVLGALSLTFDVPFSGILCAGIAAGLGSGLDLALRGRLGVGERELLAAAAAKTPRRRPWVRAWAWTIVLLIVLHVVNRGELELWALFPERLRAGDDLERLVTATLAHAHAPHLIGNLVGVVLFAPAVESRVGRLGFALVVVVSALVGHLAYAMSANVPALGFSGAVFGLCGALLGSMPRRRTVLAPMGIVFRGPAWALYPFYLAPVIFIDAVTRSQVAWQAHLGGLLAGVAIGVILRRVPETPEHVAAEAWRTSRLDAIRD